jgi:glutamate synthase (ferredoxin)
MQKANDTATVRLGAPPKQGLYDPQFEHDACGLGFVVNMKGKKSHQMVSDALKILVNLDHRGACGCEANTGDGAGILIQVPHDFFAAEAAKLGFKLPAAGQYGVGMMFLPKNPTERDGVKAELARVIAAEGQTVLGWRNVPTDNSSLGKTAVAAEPFMAQVFVGRNETIKDDEAFERKLYVIRKVAEQKIRYGNAIDGGRWFYVSSLSARTLIYKGMLMSVQVEKYYPDLREASVVSAMALVHSRFSTNTFPSWDRAHPNRYIAHNGEINTLRGNVNWMHGAQANFKSPLFGKEIKKVIPVINPDGSDSAQFDNCLELLVMAGRELPHAMMMMIPEPWENHESMDAERRAFYEYHSCLIEPWDGPASMAFTDGIRIGACLDRNGLRPSRYYVTKDDVVIMASEAGVLPIAPERIAVKGRLQPGRMFLVDTKEGRIIADEELKKKYASAHPYQKWLDEHHCLLDDLPKANLETEVSHRKLLQSQQAFGYTFEDLRFIIGPMARDGQQPLGSMGTDTPLAVLSQKPQLLYNYFKQLFAQVTNPPIDPIREEIVTSTHTMAGARGNLLNPGPESCALIRLDQPILTNEELDKLRFITRPGFKSETLPILFTAAHGADGLEAALEKVFDDADRAIKNGANILILSDRGVSSEMASIPALLATAGLHHHLIRSGTRGKVGLVLESGEPREVHHFALLIGYGCSAINPYLAYETLEDLIHEGLLTGVDHKTAIKKYIKAAIKGVVKTMAKMGISTVQSYRGAQIFEAVGINSEVVDKYFTWTPTRIQGIGLKVIAEEALARHRRAFPPVSVNPELDPGGQYQWRDSGEQHLFNPQTIHKLQTACRLGSEKIYREYADIINDRAKSLCTLRGLLDFKFAEKPLPIEEVESVESIVKRFKTGAMSYGSI